jgi:recombination protein RecA
VSVENLEQLGVDVNRGFVYVNEHCTENILSIAESTIHKARKFEKDVPFVIVWDSVAASSPKAELEGEYDKDSIGLQARAISKGMRKITGIIGNQNVLFVILNQTRSKIGAWSPTGDAQTTPGGKAIPFHSSIRIQLGAGSQIKDNNRVKGIHVWAKTIKNKVAPPFRKIEFEIHFGVGIKEHEQVFDLLRKHCDKNPILIGGHNVLLEGSGGWKSLKVWNPLEGDDFKKVKKFIVDKKFNKSKFDEVMADPEFKPYIDDLLDSAMIEIFAGAPDIDLTSNIEVESALGMIEENL